MLGLNPKCAAPSRTRVLMPSTQSGRWQVSIRQRMSSSQVTSSTPKDQTRERSSRLFLEWSGIHAVGGFYPEITTSSEREVYGTGLKRVYRAT